MTDASTEAVERLAFDSFTSDPVQLSAFLRARAHERDDLLAEVEDAHKLLQKAKDWIDRSEKRRMEYLVRAKAAEAKLEQARADVSGTGVSEAREYATDTIEEIIGETHDIDVTDRRYAENVVAWLEKYHPAAILTLIDEGQDQPTDG